MYADDSYLMRPAQLSTKMLHLCYKFGQSNYDKSECVVIKEMYSDHTVFLNKNIKYAKIIQKYLRYVY